MKWIAIAGSWKHTSPQIEKDVRDCVKEIVLNKDGIVSGGALGVDQIAADEALKHNGQLKIIIPSSLEIYKTHYLNRAREGVITHDQADSLMAQLEQVKERGFLIEEPHNVLNQDTYFDRITKIIESADELRAFQVNQSIGTQDTIDKAEKKNIPVKVYSYSL